MDKYYFVTGNQNKLREVRGIIGDDSDIQIESVSIDLPELQGTPEEIVAEKCRLAYEKLQKPCMVEDTSLCFNALNGMPGPYIKWFMPGGDLTMFSKMLEGFDDKTAYAQCIFALKTDEKSLPQLFLGRVDGQIVKPRGDNNFGWDPIFQPNDTDRTFAEMDDAEKNDVSHRRIAIETMKEHLTVVLKVE
jgi:XTP/dITP diphosphohydrolase